MYSLARNELLSTGKETSFELYLESRLVATHLLAYEFYFLHKSDPFPSLSIAVTKVKKQIPIFHLQKNVHFWPMF